MIAGLSANYYVGNNMFGFFFYRKKGLYCNRYLNPCLCKLLLILISTLHISHDTLLLITCALYFSVFVHSHIVNSYQF